MLHPSLLSHWTSNQIFTARLFSLFSRFLRLQYCRSTITGLAGLSFAAPRCQVSVTREGYCNKCPCIILDAICHRSLRKSKGVFYWLEQQSCAVNSASLDVTRPTTWPVNCNRALTIFVHFQFDTHTDVTLTNFSMFLSRPIVYGIIYSP